MKNNAMGDYRPSGTETYTITNMGEGMRRLLFSTIIVVNIIGQIRIRWIRKRIGSFSCFHRTQWATTKTINNGQETCAKRNQKHNTAYQFRMWLKVKPKRKRYRKSDCGLLHAIQIRARIPLRFELGDFLVPFDAPFFFILYYFFQHNRHSTSQPNLLQH